MSDVEQQIAEEMGDDESAPEEATTADGDGQDGETGQAEAEAAPPAPRTQKEIEAIQRALEKEAERHDKRVREIMGDDYAMLVPSPVDWTPGYIFNVEGMRPDDEALAVLDAIIGREAGADFLPAEDAQPCEKCGALGRTLTGSRVQGQETKPCSTCSGSGWVPKLALPQVPAPAMVYGNGNTGNPVAPNQVAVADRWGRPSGHPHYGLEPALVS